MQNAAPLEIHRLPIIGRSMPEVSTVTSTWRSGAAPTRQPWRRYWSGGFWPAWKFAINAREERRQHSAHRSAARNFCVHIRFTAHNSMKGSSHGGTCKCPKCRLGRPGQRTGSSRGGQRSPRQCGLRDRQVPEEAPLYDVGIDAGAWLSARGHVVTLAPGGRAEWAVGGSIWSYGRKLRLVSAPAFSSGRFLPLYSGS